MIAVECHVDTYLIKRLGVSKKKRHHAESKGRVLKFLEKDERCTLGLVDEDPNSSQPRLLDKYSLVFDEFDRSGLRLLSYKDKYLIMVRDDIEHWLCNRANHNNIDLKNYKLPRDPVKLHSIPRLDKRRNFQKFIDDLIASGDKGVETLHTWLHSYGDSNL